jgi:hypothetical protein
MRTALLSVLLIGCNEYELTEAVDEIYAEPDILVTPGELFFGILEDDETATQVLTIENQGNANLDVVMLLIEGEGFSSVNSFPMQLPPETSAEVYVNYTPTSTSDVGVATVVSNDPDSNEIAVPLYGGYVGPKLLIEPEAISFDEQMLDCHSSEVFTLTNIGSAPLDLYGVTIEDESGYFEISEPPENWTLDPKRSTEVEVSFVPMSDGGFTSVLHVDSNDPDGEQLADVVGMGEELGMCANLELSFLVEYEIADISFLLDTTGSMGSLATAMGSDFAGIAKELNNEIEDITFGVATYRDYNFSSFGGQGDLPFQLETQQTSDLSRVQSALNGISASGGGDGEESAMEAIYQATNGKGYDQDCDGYYDPSTDVPPFERASDDAFGGNESGNYSSGVEGTGELGGMGFREDVLPIIILGTDAPLRDPDNGYPGPGGCLQDAGKDAASAGLASLDAKLIGVGVGGATSYFQTAGIADSVVQWSSGSNNFQDTIVDAVIELIGDVTFDEVWLDVASDQYNMVDSVDPNYWTDVPSGTQVDFTVTVNSALVAEASEVTYPVILELYARIDDSSWLLDTHIVNVLIPESNQ